MTGTDADARSDLVRAAAELIAEDLVAVVAQGLRPDDVAARAGRSRRSLYAHFPDRRDLVHAVAEYVLGDDIGDSGSSLDWGTVAELGATVDTAEGDLLETVRVLTHGTFKSSLASERSVLTRQLWALAATDPAIADRYRVYLQTSDRKVAAVIEAVNERLGIRLREPWNAQVVSVVVRALADGMALRNRLDPDAGDADTYSLAGLSLLSVLAQPVAEPPVSLVDHITGFTREVLQGWRDQHVQSDLTDGRDRIMVALREAVTELGTGVDLEEVAMRSGLSRQTIVAAFGSLEGLVDAAVMESMPDLDGEAEFDLATVHLDVADVVRRHLLRIADWATQEPQLAALVVAAGADNARSVGSDAARRFLGKASKALTAILEHFAGDREADPQLMWTATTCTGALLSRVTTASQPLTETVQWLTHVAIAMIDAPPLRPSPDDER